MESREAAPLLAELLTPGTGTTVKGSPVSRDAGRRLQDGISPTTDFTKYLNLNNGVQSASCEVTSWATSSRCFPCLEVQAHSSEFPGIRGWQVGLVLVLETIPGTLEQPISISIPDIIVRECAGICGPENAPGNELVPYR